MNQRLRLVPLCGLGLIAAMMVTSCAAGHDATAAPIAGTNSDPAVSYEVRAVTVGRQFAECARAHGRPDVRDPVIRDGVLTWPGVDKADIEAVEAPCGAIWRQVPPPSGQADAPTPEQLALMRQFARCMRDHEVTEFPDPTANGTFPFGGTPLEAESKGQGPGAGRFRLAHAACRQYEQGWQIRVS